MADTTEGDSHVLYLGLVAPTLTALIFGLVIHSFIIGVNVNDWWKGRSVTPVNLIVIYLGISRMGALCFNTLYLFVLMLFPRSLDFHVPVAMFISTAYNFFTYLNVWLTTLLSIVFFLKISNLHSRLFLYLRRVIVQRTIYFIAASVLLSTLNCLFSLLSDITVVTKGRTYNTTMDHLFTDCIYTNYIYNYTIKASIPLLFSYISSVHLFTSLYHHATKMKMSSNLTLNLETYYSVMKFISFTFICNTLYFIGHFVCVFYNYFYCVNIDWLYIILDFLPVLHSSYLIYRTAKLRNQMSKLLQNVVNFFLRRKDAETRGNIEVVAQ